MPPVPAADEEGGELRCELADGRHIALPVSPDLTLLDLRHMLFSLTDIDPDRIHITLPPRRGGATLRPHPPTDAARTLRDAGIRPGDTVAVAEAGDKDGDGDGDGHGGGDVGARASMPTPTPTAAQRARAAPRNRITVEDLAAALEACRLARAEASSARSTASAATPPPTPVDVAPTSAPGAAVASAAPPPSPAAPPAAPPAGATPAGTQFIARIASHYAAAMEYEDPELQAKARACIPVDALRAEAARSGRACPDAALTKALLSWFKRDFFVWVNSPPCWACGGESESVGGVAPTATEAKHRAGRVELHQCKTCHAQQRFPRYNDPAKLLETRRGRCGEWQQVFTLMCISLGLVARAAHDETDHVWTEVWSSTEFRWLHADSCEDCLDEPLLYESGWGKKLTYVIATGKGCVADVTRRYTTDFSVLLSRRTIVGEDWLASQIAALHRQAVAAVPAAERALVLQRNEADERHLRGDKEALSTANLPGRQSGSRDWVRSRGEDGDKS